MREGRNHLNEPNANLSMTAISRCCIKLQSKWHGKEYVKSWQLLPRTTKHQKHYTWQLLRTEVRVLNNRADGRVVHSQASNCLYCALMKWAKDSAPHYPKLTVSILIFLSAHLGYKKVSPFSWKTQKQRFFKISISICILWHQLRKKIWVDWNR